MIDYSATMAMFCRASGLPVPESEYRFNPDRRWRFDFCWVDAKLAIEVNGGIFSNGRHTRGTGYTADMEKLNSAQLLGYRVLQYTPQQIRAGDWVDDVMAILEGEK